MMEMVFGSWTVIGSPFMANGKQRVAVRCVCGTETTTQIRYLTGGRSRSCWPCAMTKHGQTETPTWNSWQGMRDRCRYAGGKDHHNYGGRGITFCERWDSFANFLADMGERPPGLTLDRIDPNGDYEPGNCRWATALEQASTRRAKPTGRPKKVRPA
jgi:hypothetical protein